MVSQLYYFGPGVRQNLTARREYDRGYSPMAAGKPGWGVATEVCISGLLSFPLWAIMLGSPLDGAIYIQGKSPLSVTVPNVSYLWKHPHRHTGELALLILRHF